MGEMDIMTMIGKKMKLNKIIEEQEIDNKIINKILDNNNNSNNKEEVIVYNNIKIYKMTCLDLLNKEEQDKLIIQEIVA
jgi:hypothetical protein